MREVETDSWLVLEKKDNVGFSDRLGPWLHVTPANNKEKALFSRWVHEFDDKDFTVL